MRLICIKCHLFVQISINNGKQNVTHISANFGPNLLQKHSKFLYTARLKSSFKVTSILKTFIPYMR